MVKSLTTHSCIFFLFYIFGHCCRCSFFSLSSSQVPTGNFLWTCHLTSTRIKLCPWQSLTFDTHWIELNFELKNQASVLWGNVRYVQKIARYIKLLIFEPNYAIMFYVKVLNSSLTEISKWERKTTTKCAWLNFGSESSTSYMCVYSTSPQTD